MSDENIKRYSVAELEAMRAQRGSLTDWERVRSKTEQELEQDIAGDPDWSDIPADWFKDAYAVYASAEAMRLLRVDADVLDWFERQGPDHKGRMNAVLRAFMEQNARAQT